MRRPDGADVAWIQLVVRVACRLAIVGCLLMLVPQGLSVVDQLIQRLRGTRYSPSLSELIIGGGIRIWPRIAFWLGSAAVLWLLQGRLIRWVVPMPRPECPACGHGFADETPVRCAECGARLD